METKTNCHQMFVAGNIWNFSLTATKLSKKFGSPFPHCVDLFSPEILFLFTQMGVLLLLFCFSHFYLVCVWHRIHMESRDSFWEWVLYLQHMGPKDQTKVVQPGSRHLCPLSHLAGSWVLLMLSMIASDFYVLRGPEITDDMCTSSPSLLPHVQKCQVDQVILRGLCLFLIMNTKANVFTFHFVKSF